MIHSRVLLVINTVLAGFQFLKPIVSAPREPGVPIFLSLSQSQG